MKYLVLILALLAAPANAESLSDINDRINKQIRYVGEMPGQDVWRVADTWGDCEDIALRKLVEFAKIGVSGRIGVYYDTVYKQWHAVLVADGRVFDSRRAWWDKTRLIRPATSEKFLYFAEVRNGVSWLTLAGKPHMEPIRHRSIVNE